VLHFIANLKPYLARPGRGVRRFDGYLLSADYQREHGKLLPVVRGGGRVLVADNGNVDEIGALIARFTPAAAPLHARRKAAERALGRRARPGDLPAALVAAHRALAERVAAASAEVADEARARAVLPVQAGMAPDYLVAMEDFTITALAGLGLQPEYTGLPLGWYRRLSERAVGFARATGAGAYGPCGDALPFAGLHGIDFDTARQAGRAAGEADAAGIATGLAGALADRSFTDFRVQDGALEPLPEAVPRPYLRALDVAAGLHHGYAEATGRRPRFHALGAGSPILVPLLALLGDAGTYTALDSTAPILDAYSSQTVALYVREPAPLKLKAHRLAQSWLAGGPAWDCPCPYCRGHDRRHPPRVAAGRAWWAAEGKRPLTPSDLRAPSPLAEFLPLLGAPAGPAARVAAGMARIGHNHWVLRRLEAEAQRHAADGSLRPWAEEVVGQYLTGPGDADWKAATRAAWNVADATAARLVDAAPGGELTGARAAHQPPPRLSHSRPSRTRTRTVPSRSVRASSGTPRSAASVAGAG
jgi:hypothetical protein